MHRRAALAVTAAVCTLGVALSGCGASSPAGPAGSTGSPASSIDATVTDAPASGFGPVSSAAPTSATPTSTTPTSATPTSATPTSTTPTSTASTRAASPAVPAGSAPPSGATIPYGDRPVIVIDPGHSPSIHAIDRRSGLNVSDYENEPEMHDVYRVALLVRAQLVRAGYRVVMTKKSVDQRVDLAQRAYIANRAHAALALSIHDQAGSNGGIGFRQGNNTVYYQSVGTYRATPDGKRVYFRNRHLAAVSKKFGAIFRRQREAVQRTHVNFQGNVGYDLGSRGLAPGDIWIVQLLSTVPWIYNEAGGNSAGRIGLDPADRHTYALGLVRSVETCVPLPAR